MLLARLVVQLFLWRFGVGNLQRFLGDVLRGLQGQGGAWRLDKSIAVLHHH